MGKAPSAKIDEIRRLEVSVDSFLGKREGPYLYSLAQFGAKLGAVVEIGTYKGRSAIWLAKGAQAVGGQLVYTIDPHYGGSESELRENISRSGLSSVVIPMVMPSMQALENWKVPIGFLWIDGDHSYEGARSDFYGWSRHVIEGGVLALHDTYSFEGVRKLVDEEILKLKGYRVLGQVDSILALQKIQSMSVMDRARRYLTVRLRRIFNRARVKRKHWRALPRKLMRGLAKSGYSCE